MNSSSKGKEQELERQERKKVRNSKKQRKGSGTQEARKAKGKKNACV